MKMKTCAVIVAAGSSTRMGFNKITYDFGGETPMSLCVNAMLGAEIDEIVLVVSDKTVDLAKSLKRLHDDIKIVYGGSHRGESVFNGLKATDSDIVLIHDCARCLITSDIVKKSVADIIEFGSSIVGINDIDTTRSKENHTLYNRDDLFLTQTPQGFFKNEILECYEKANKDLIEATDDCAIYEKYSGKKAHFTQGSVINQKLTRQEDIAFFDAIIKSYKEKK